MNTFSVKLNLYISECNLVVKFSGLPFKMQDLDPLTNFLKVPINGKGRGEGPESH